MEENVGESVASRPVLQDFLEEVHTKREQYQRTTQSVRNEGRTAM